MNALAAILLFVILYSACRFVLRVAIETARLVAVVAVCVVLLAVCATL